MVRVLTAVQMQSMFDRIRNNAKLLWKVKGMHTDCTHITYYYNCILNTKIPHQGIRTVCAVQSSSQKRGINDTQHFAHVLSKWAMPQSIWSRIIGAWQIKLLIRLMRFMFTSMYKIVRSAANSSSTLDLRLTPSFPFLFLKFPPSNHFSKFLFQQMISILFE